MQTITIHLKQLRFFAYHGWHPQEQQTGNQFELNIIVKLHPAKEVVRKLEDTVNYADIYELVKKRMEKATPLLETVVMELAEEIAAAHPVIAEMELFLDKLTAPIAGMDGRVGVSYSWKKNN